MSSTSLSFLQAPSAQCSSALNIVIADYQGCLGGVAKGNSTSMSTVSACGCSSQVSMHAEAMASACKASLTSEGNESVNVTINTLSHCCNAGDGSCVAQIKAFSFFVGYYTVAQNNTPATAGGSVTQANPSSAAADPASWFNSEIHLLTALLLLASYL